MTQRQHGTALDHCQEAKRQDKVGNFIRLNEKTINKQHTMSRPEELVNRVAGSKYISRTDLRSAYWQCLLSPENRKYTAFQTPFGTYNYCRMGMGLKCANAMCQ